MDEAMDEAWFYLAVQSWPIVMSYAHLKLTLQSEDWKCIAASLSPSQDGMSIILVRFPPWPDPSDISAIAISISAL